MSTFASAIQSVGNGSVACAGACAEVKVGDTRPRPHGSHLAHNPNPGGESWSSPAVCCLTNGRSRLTSVQCRLATVETRACEI
jgi:hypothetical protein